MPTINTKTDYFLEMKFWFTSKNAEKKSIFHFEKPKSLDYESPDVGTPTNSIADVLVNDK